MNVFKSTSSNLPSLCSINKSISPATLTPLLSVPQTTTLVWNLAPANTYGLKKVKNFLVTSTDLSPKDSVNFSLLPNISFKSSVDIVTFCSLVSFIFCKKSFKIHLFDS